MPSRAVVRQSRSQFAAARPSQVSFSHLSLLHHWAALEACCLSRLFLKGLAQSTYIHARIRGLRRELDHDWKVSVILDKETQLVSNARFASMTPHNI
jgi:hypothetical protein